MYMLRVTSISRFEERCLHTFMLTDNSIMTNFISKGIDILHWPTLVHNNCNMLPVSMTLQRAEVVLRGVQVYTWMQSGTPVLSIRLATLTVFPQMSYWGFLAPITPATTGPMFNPENKSPGRVTSC